MLDGSELDASLSGRKKQPFIISLVGRHNAGKTTVGEDLVAGWTQMGFSVAVLKHEGMHGDGFEGERKGPPDWEKQGSDTTRYAAKGARYTVVAGGGESLWRVTQEPDGDNPDIMVKKVQDFIEISGEFVDIILVEGYKGSALPKVVVLRDEADVAWIQSFRPRNVIAAVCPTDFACLAAIPWRVYHDSYIRQLCADLMHQ